MAFDYTAIETPDDVVRSVAAEMSGGGLKPLSDEERLERAAWRKEQALLAQKLSAERQRHQQEQDAIARAEQAAELAEANKKRRVEREAEISRLSFQREIADLRYQSAQQQGWQNRVQLAVAVRNQIVQRQGVLNELEALAPPPPAPAPEPLTASDDADDGLGSPNIGDENFNPRYWLQKPIFRT